VPTRPGRSQDPKRLDRHPARPRGRLLRDLQLRWRHTEPARLLALWDPGHAAGVHPARHRPRRMKEAAEEEPLRTPVERLVGHQGAELFERSSDPVEVRIENFPKYVRRQHLTRFLALYELFKVALPIKGSVVECGVNRGFGVMTWAKLSAILEPNNLTRRIYGFDSFEGFPEVHEKDAAARGRATAVKGGLAADSYAELLELIELYDKDRFLGHIDKIALVKGDAVTTIP